MTSNEPDRDEAAEWRQGRRKRTMLFVYASVGCGALGGILMVVLAAFGVFNGEQSTFPDSTLEWVGMVAIGAVLGALLPLGLLMKSLELGN